MRAVTLQTLLVLSAITSPCVGDFTSFPICTATGNQHCPIVGDNLVVWHDDRNGNYDIYGYDLIAQTEIPICTLPSQQCSPAAHGNRVVWQDNRNGNYDIYEYSLATHEESPICVRSGDQSEPLLSDDLLVWLDSGTGIYARVLSTGTEFPIAPPSAEGPLRHLRACDGRYVLWSQWRDLGEQYELYVSEVQNGRVIGTRELCRSGARQADVSGNVAVWEQLFAGHKMLWVHDLASGEQFTILDEQATYDPVPAIDGENIVFHSVNVTPDEILGYDLVTRAVFPICENPLNGVVSLEIHQNLVVWSGHGNLGTDIYGAYIPDPGSLSLLTLGGLAVLRRRRK